MRFVPVKCNNVANIHAARLPVSYFISERVNNIFPPELRISFHSQGEWVPLFRESSETKISNRKKIPRKPTGCRVLQRPMTLVVGGWHAICYEIDRKIRRDGHLTGMSQTAPMAGRHGSRSSQGRGRLFAGRYRFGLGSRLRVSLNHAAAAVKEVSQ